MLEQDPIVGIAPSKSVMSVTGHPYKDYTQLRRAPCCCFCHQIAQYCSYVTVSVIANIIMETTMLITSTIYTLLL